MLVTLDTLRYDAVHSPPGDVPAMPRLAARARRGLAFSRAYSATSSTQPTHATLFTAEPPWRHGVTRNGQVLAPEARTVAEVFREAGWNTVAVAGAYPCAARFGLAQGFGVFDEEFQRGRPDNPMWNVQAPEARFYRLADAVTRATIGRLDEAPAGPQFLWVHYFDAHAPYGDGARGPLLRPRDVLETAARRQPTGELLIRARALYRADAESLDLSLEALLSRLEQDAGRWDTHVVITADHGESLGEDASVGHGRRLTPAQIHVPLVVLSPVVSSAVREDVAGSIDVAPTLLALAGIRERMPGGRNLLAPAVTSASAFGMRRTFARPHDDRRLDGVHRLDFELFYAAGPDGRLLTGNGDGLRELAPGTSASPEEEQRLRRLFGSFERELQTGTPARTDPEAEEALRALGYVG